ncbi:MAG: hypothetical protein Tp132SUR00d2C45923861_15 [Prokaryotic dsDNA virus sp.]|nr:MAG: hypothetical protein Tp132SUR00d2C45923861_15 [Prokaryotic dsDNA virus sp.]|tara:strand:- start:17323 stop:25122 length:7800 start_codon:yes stop_codon:yes gene_type:complete
MPRQLVEIKNFDIGTILNSSEKDIPEDSSAFSLNINPTSENGILTSINCDKLFLNNIENTTTISSPMSWDNKAYNNSNTFSDLNKHHIDDVTIFEEKSSADISYIGTKGFRENIIAQDIKPWYEKIIAVDGSQLTFYPSPGIFPNDDYIPYLSATNSITESVTNFAATGFTNGEATITITGNSIAGETFIITTPDGKEVTYEIDHDGTPANGELKGSNTCVQLDSTLGSATNMATRVKEAIENTTNGHGTRISITQASGVLTLTYAQNIISEYLPVNSYFSLATANYNSNEIIKVESIDEDNNRIYIKRGCFGTPIESYAASTKFFIYSNKITIDGTQANTTRGYFNIVNESKYSGNHIGGNSSYLNRSTTQANNAVLGGTIASASYNVSYDSTAKTISIAGVGISSLPFYEGDTINVYHSDTHVSNGFSAKILKIAGSNPIVLTLDTAPTTTETESSDTVYIEANLIKNHTFTHKQGTTGSLASTYACNDWTKHRLSDANPEGSARHDNDYQTTNSSNVAIVTSGGGYWETSNGNIDLGGTSDNALNFYPFIENDVYLKIVSTYVNAGNDGGSVTLTNALAASMAANTLILSRDVSNILAIGDIISSVGAGSVVEYMKVLSVENRQIKVKRAYFDATNLVAHSAATNLKKNVNYLARQTISKDLLKPGQDYVLSFYAKTTAANVAAQSRGALSISFNGGYINYEGNWVSPSKNVLKGHLGNDPKNLTKEDRWIGIEELDKPNNDIAVGTNPIPTASGLDEHWRKYILRFSIPKGIELTTDVELDLCARGQDTNELHVDLIDLIEDTKIIYANKNSLLKTNVLLDNGGIKDLVSYDSIKRKLQVITSIFEEPTLKENFTKSFFAATTITSSIEDASIVIKNREAHIGFGGGKGDTPPQWLGYPAHKLFDADYTSELYQDEDTVHKYDGESTAGLNLSKICLAGEHERLVATWNASNADLTIAHARHSMNIGDNIVIRQYKDVSNSWDGSGVWIVESTTTNTFVCVRATTYDANPTVASGSLAFDTDSDGTKDNAESLISYRPYYYYGIKDGDNCIYRIWPDAKLGGGGSGDDSLNTLSTTYTKGKIERSLPINTEITSIATCYNKKTDGTGGGRIYILSSINNQVLSYDVQVKYDEWETKSLNEVSTMDLVFKSFKWSNDNVTGDIGGNTEVFGGLSEVSTPTINYSGLLSDIIETKAPNETLDFDETTNAGYTEDMFDTRLWIQSRPDAEGFSEGDRFLFCALTNDTNTDGPDILYCADRTPPTTMVTNVFNNPNKFIAGPGLEPTASKRSYFKPWIHSNNTLDRIAPVIDSEGNIGTVVNGEAGGYHEPYINFGHNVGWDAGEDNNNQLSIKVAKYGLFQMADNNGDGIIDGTGLVSPNDTTMTSATEGPYGKYHQHVCGHVVGLIGGCNLNWVKHWGRMHNVDHSGYFNVGFGDGPHQDAPELMKADKCIFVSSDTHYGDDQPDEEYTFNAKATVDSGKMTELTVDSSNGVTGLNIGDTVYLTHPGVASVINSVDRSNNKITVTTVYSDFSSASGSIYPHAIHLLNRRNTGGVLDGAEAFHWSFDSRDPLNGDIFTEGEGSGHYTKTYMTPPSYWGGPKGTSGDYSLNINPGLLWKIEKLSFRAGVMIRPFSMDDDDFNDLIIGNGVSVDMPCYPNPVYHTKQGTKLHYDVDNSSSSNAFASKLFITCPIKNDDEQRSKIYICDMDFLYPSQGLQVQKEQTVGNGNTNSVNNGTSWDVLISGIIKDYDDTATASTLEGDNDKRPCIHIDTDEITYDSTDDLSLFFANSQYRDLTNSLSGLCISIKDATTGMIQTRYIVGSFKLGNSTGDDIIVKVHYPFAHTPADNDQFWIWSHANAATAPVRLYKTKTLPHGLGDAILADPLIGDTIYKDNGTVEISSTGIVTTGTHHNLTTNDKIEITDTTSYNNIYTVTVTGPDTLATIGSSSGTETGNWKLLTGSNETSTSNPLAMQLTSPVLKTTFGGLDMRKTRVYNVNSVSSTSSSEQKLHIDNPSAHLLFTGDTITYDAGGGNELDGTYNIDKVDDDEIDITTTATDTDSGTAYTNQWEGIISDNSSSSNMGEIRAGFTSWDKGDAAGNVLRHDSTADGDRYTAYGNSSVTIESVSLPNQTGDYFVANNAYYYKVSFIYDGYQEGPLSDSHWLWNDTFSRAKLVITIKVKNPSRRLTAVCLYRKDSTTDLYKLVEEIPTDTGWSKESESYCYTLSDSGSLQATYETRSGISEVLDTIKIKYGISTEIDGYLFVGDCSHSKIEKASNMVFRSKPGKYSVFDYANDFLVLKSKPTAMANFLGRLYVFDNLNIYRVNPENLVIEDIYEGIGCFGKDSLVVTEKGMFFADKTGAYFHNGQSPIKISERIQKAGSTEVSFGGTDNVRDLSWSSIVKNNPKAKPYVFYDAIIDCVLFNIEILDNDATYNTPLLRQYIWAYSILKQTWNLWELAEDSKIGKPFNGENGEVLIPINNAIYENRGGATKRDYTWISKKLTMNEDSIMKVFNKIKINGLSKNLNLGGNYLESSDRLLVVTSTGSLSSDSVTYSKTATESSDYKLSGTNKKGRWVQLKLENIKDNIDSVGIIFRRKSTK